MTNPAGLVFSIDLNVVRQYSAPAGAVSVRILGPAVDRHPDRPLLPAAGSALALPVAKRHW